MPTQTFNNLSFEKKHDIYHKSKVYLVSKAFENAKVTEICEITGIKRRTFYSYFSSLEDLYNYVFAFSNMDCKTLFEENNFLEDLRTKGFSEELFHVFESYYLSVICSDYGLRKLFEFINTNKLNERKILNLLVALLKQYELGVLNKEALIEEINLSI